MTESYTHVVYARDGRQFSIHKSEADAAFRATQIGGTWGLFTPNHSTYWNNRKQTS